MIIINMGQAKIVNFKVNSAGINLHAKINLTSRKAPVVILIPGSSGKALTDRFNWLSGVFMNNGYSFVRFNFRGYEEDQSLEAYSLENEIEDFRGVLKKLEKIGLDINNYGVVAKSLGALKAIGIQDPRLKCLGLLAPAVSVDVKNNLARHSKYLYRYVGEYFEYKIDPEMVNKKTATIVFYGSNDDVVRPIDTKKLYEVLPDPKEIFRIQHESHELNKPGTQLFISERLISFFKKYLPP